MQAGSLSEPASARVEAVAVPAAPVSPAEEASAAEDVSAGAEVFALTDLIVHRPPMLLLDSVVEHSDERLTASVCVSAAHPFAANGEVPGVIAIEYLAQAVAAHQGLLDLRAGRAVCEGFLLGTRQFDIHRDTLPVGLKLLAMVAREFDLGGEFGRYVGRLVEEAGGACVAEGDLKVFQSPQWVAELKGAGS